MREFLLGSVAANTNVTATWDGKNTGGVFVPDSTYVIFASNGTNETTSPANATGSVVVDNTNPTVSLNSPANNALVSGNITLDASPLDEGGNDNNILNVEFYVDGNLVGTDGSSGGGWNISFNTASIADGSHSWTAKAFDKAGNNVSSASRMLNVQNTGTYTAVINPTTALTGSPVSYTITATNTTSPTSVAIGSVSVAIPAGGGTPTSVTVTATDPGAVSRSWAVDGSPPAGLIRFSRSGGGANDIDPGGTVVIQFSATASTTGSKEWTTTAYTNNNYTQPFNLQGAQPTVTVCTSLTITTNPTSQTVCAGSSVAFTSSASATPSPTVQWQVSTDGGANFSNLGGATSTTLTFTTSASQNGNKYRAVFSNACQTVNSTAATLTVNTSPVITCPANITVGNGIDSCGGVVNFSATASGSPAPTFTYTPPSGSFFPVGTTTVKAKATNTCGSDSCTFTVTVNDVQKPHITCPANIVRNNDPGQCSAVITFSVTATDNCPGTTVVSTPPSGYAFPRGVTTVKSIATDGAGNKDSCSFTVTVIDNTPPVITGCPTSQTVYTGPGRTTCDQTASWAAPSATDNCAMESFTSNHAPGATFPKGTTTVTYTAKDSSGNISTCSFTVTVIDNTPPVITGCPSSQTVYTGPGRTTCDQTASWSAPSATDNCAMESFTSNYAPGATFPKGTTTLTYTAKDSAGNTSTCSFTVTVIDNTPPVISNCPSNQTVYTGTGRTTCDQTASWTAPSATDNCALESFTSNYAPGATFPKGTTTVTYTAKDSAGNTSTCSFTVTVIDNTPPVISNCPTNQTVYTGTGRTTCDQTASWTAPAATDNCALESFTSNYAPGATFSKGTTTVTYTAKDSSGNTSTCSFTVTVIDNTPPVITGCPANQTVYTGPGRTTCDQTASWSAPSATDNCAMESFTSNYAPGATFPKGTTTVTYTAKDSSGNISTCSFTVTVIDNTPPVISNCPANQTVYTGPGRTTCDQTASWSAPSATDNCAMESFTSNYAPGATFPKGTTTVTYTAKDSSGNTSTCSFTVTVIDNTPPVISNCPTNQTVYTGPGRTTCDQTASWTAPSATDNCALESFTSNYAPGATFPKGTTTVTYTAKDSAGNTSTCSFTVTVIDNTPPVISNCPSNQTVYTGPGRTTCDQTASWSAPSATDNCAMESFTSNYAPGATFPKGTTTVTYAAKDSSGNTSTCSFTVTVIDNTPPLITGCPTNQTVYTGPGRTTCDQTASWTAPSATDNCALESFTSNYAPGATFPKGTTTVTYTAKDSSGNTSTCSFTVTVIDNTPPVITGCPTSQTVYTGPGRTTCDQTASWTAPSATDNCAMESFTSNYAPGATFPKGTTTVTYTAKDSSGNISTCSFTVTVIDNTPPVITGCPTSQTVYTGPGRTTCDQTASWTAPSATDNCALESFTSNYAPGATFPKGTTTVTYTAKDSSGNTSTCSFTVTVIDNTPPVITGCPTSQTVYTGPGRTTCDQTATWTAPSATDNCALESFTSNYAPGATFSKGTTTVTYTAKDSSGNTSTCSFTVTVIDNTPPVISNCPANQTVYTGPGRTSCDQTASWTTPSATDNCALESFTSNYAPGATFSKGTTTVTYTAKDSSGNTSTCSFTVTVIDNTPPVITGCPASQTVYTGPGRTTCDQTATWTAPSATDNCTLESFTSNYAPGATFPKGTTTVTYTAKDSSGNTSTCSFTVTVIDNTPPVITGCPTSQTVYTGPGRTTCDQTASWTAPSATDNCALESFTSNYAPGATFPKGTTTVTYTAKDSAGNTSTCSFTVTVIDNTPPVIAGCPTNQTVYTGPGRTTCDQTASWSAPSATDNCALEGFTSNYAPGATFSRGTTTVTYTAKDSSGNTSTCSFTVTVIDNTPPVISNCPSNQTVYTGPGRTTCDQTATWTAPSATDNCALESFTSNYAPGATFPKGTTTVTYTAKDSSGNTSTCSFTVTVIDNTSPVITGCPTSQTVYIGPGRTTCDQTATWTAPAATDNCAMESFTSNFIPGATFPKGTTTVTYTAKDSSGNISTCSFTVTVIDNTPPAITGCPANQTVYTGPGRTTCDQTATWTAPSATDNCAMESFTSNYAPGATFPKGTTTVTYTAKDSSGNTSTCSFTVTVIDNTPPVITGCPSNQTVYTGPGRTTCDQTATWTAPSATDNCALEGFTSNYAPGATFPKGTTTVTYTAKDSSGNISTCSFTVTVIDNTPPVISGCPTSQTVYTGPGRTTCDQAASWTAPSATDNCALESFTSNFAPGATFPKGTTTVTYTAKDSSGNISTCSFTVTVIDNTPPVISGCPTSQTVYTGPGRTTCDQAASWTAPSATDNCALESFTSNYAPGATFSKGTTTVTYTAKDSSGNTSTCSFTVTVIDNTPPVITGCPANQTVYTGPGRTTCDQTATWSAPTATDNCAMMSLTSNYAPGSTFSKGTTTVTYTAKDSAGNVSACSFTVTVIDNTPPVITGCPANKTVYTGPGRTTCDQTATWTAPSATDNCAMMSMIPNYAPGATFPKGTTTVTYTAKDSSGNTSTCSFTVTVIDNTPPQISCPANITRQTDPGLCTAVVTFAPTASDNCGVVTTLCSPASGYAFPVGTTTVTCTATDGSGNTASCTFTVTVTNATPVVTITGPPSGSIYAAGTPVTFTGSFTDNSGDIHNATWSLDATTVNGSVNEGAMTVSATYTFNTAGVYNVSLTVKDQCGNTGTAIVIGGFNAMVVVYDPKAGFVTGGGWINSPLGAYRADTTLTGKANFGFVSKYQKGQSIPSGETEFQFQTGSFNFHSTIYDWLVIAGARAQYKGSGTINGAGDYGFILTAIDGQINGGGNIDKFRIKVWNKTTSSIIYDNQFGAPDSSAPTTALGGGSIVIHQNGAISAVGIRPSELGSPAAPKEYALYQNYPNPFNPTTEIRFDLPEVSDVSISIYNVVGEEVMVLARGEQGGGEFIVQWSGQYSSGREAPSGIYFLRMAAQSIYSDRHAVSVIKMILVR